MRRQSFRHRRLSEPVYSVLKKTVLSFKQAFYNQSVLDRRAVSHRPRAESRREAVLVQIPLPARRVVSGSCRASRSSTVRERRLHVCGVCAGVCPGNAQPDEKGQWRDAECLVCRNCDDVCPQNAVSFGFRAEADAGAGPGKAAGLVVGVSRHRRRAAAADNAARQGRTRMTRRSSGRRGRSRRRNS